MNNFSETFINKEINNPKADWYDYRGRFREVVSDPSNLLIPRVENAGTIENDCIIMHNGIKVLKNSYYQDFSEIFTINKGCHEPSEERLFNEVLKFIPENGLMIELGSYWCFYTIWFNKMVKNARNYCIEPLEESIQIGKKNCELNNVSNVDVSQGFIGKNEGNISMTKYIKEKNIDYVHLLHSDIQGYELEMLEDITDLLDNQKIKYLFISTHSNHIHYKCIDLLKKHNYKIIASADFDEETFCYDGIIVSTFNNNNEIPFIHLGNRKHTQLKEL